MNTNLIELFYDFARRGVATVEFNGQLTFTSEEAFTVWYLQSERVRYSDETSYRKQLAMIRAAFTR